MSEYVRVVGAKPDPPLPACSQRSQIQSFLPAHSESRFSATSLLPAKPVSPLPTKLDPPLPACYQRSQIVREVRVSIPPLPACYQRSQIVRGESKHSTATSLLPVKLDPKLLASSLQIPILCYQRSNNHPNQLASSESSSTATSEAGSTTTGEGSFTATSKAVSTSTSLLPAKPVLPLPAKPDPPLPACSRRSQIAREVRGSMSEQWDQACQSFKSEYIRVMQAYQLWKWACQLWEQAC